MTEIRQLFDKQGRQLEGQGGGKEEVLEKALLHAASDVWIWRIRNNAIEILLQKRAANKKVWPNCLDMSAGGHIDLGEDPISAAIRETKEEINLEINPDELRFIGVKRDYSSGPENSWIENEFQYVYSLHLKADVTFSLDDGEVDSLLWKPLAEIKSDLNHDESRAKYSPRGATYFAMVFEEIERLAISE